VPLIDTTLSHPDVELVFRDQFSGLRLLAEDLPTARTYDLAMGRCTLTIRPLVRDER